MDSTEQELRRVVAQAERARAIIDDPLLVGAFEALDARYLMKWRYSPADQPEMRERIWLYLQAIAEVRAELNTVLNDGTMAKAALDEMRAGNSTP
jgi:hypothetical protein